MPIIIIIRSYDIIYVYLSIRDGDVKLDQCHAKLSNGFVKRQGVQRDTALADTFCHAKFKKKNIKNQMKR